MKNYLRQQFYQFRKILYPLIGEIGDAGTL